LDHAVLLIMNQIWSTLTQWRIPASISLLSIVYIVVSMASWTAPLGFTISDGENFIGRWRWSYIDGYVGNFSNPTIVGWYWVENAQTATWRVTASGSATLSINGDIVFNQSVDAGKLLQESVSVPLIAGNNLIQLSVQHQPSDKFLPLITKIEKRRLLPNSWQLLDHSRSWTNEPGIDPGVTVSPSEAYTHARREQIAGTILAVSIIWLLFLVGRVIGAAYSVHRWIFYGAIFIVSAIPRLILMVDRTNHDPDFYSLPQGTDNYINLSRGFLNGSYSLINSLWGQGNILWLAGVQSIIGLDPVNIHLVHVIFSAIGCVLIIDIAWRLYGIRAAKLSALLCVFYTPLMVYQTSIFVAGAGTSFFVVMVWLMVRYAQDIPSNHQSLTWLFLGLVTAINIYFRTSLLIALIVLPVFIWYVSGSWRVAIQKSVPTIIIVVICILPLHIENRRNGSTALLSNNGPQNLHIGNNDTATGTFDYSVSFRAYHHYDYDSRSEAIIDAIQSDPFRALELLLLKVALFWEPTEDGHSINVNSNGYTLSPFLAALSLGRLSNFGILTIFTIAGLTLTDYRKNRLAVLLPMMIMSYTAIIAVVFVVSRFRAPLTPLLLIAASGIALYLPQQQDYKKILVGVGLGIGVVCIVLATIHWLPRPRYYRVDTLPETVISQNATFDDAIQFIGYEPLRHAVVPNGVIAGRLYFARIGELETDYFVSAQLLSDNGEQLIADGGDWEIGTTGYPAITASDWSVGQGLRDEFFIPLPTNFFATEDTIYHLSIALVRPDGSRAAITQAALPTSNNFARITSFYAGNLPPIQRGNTNHQIQVGETLQLTSSTLSDNAMLGEPIAVNLTWQSINPTYQTLHYTAILLNDAGEIVNQVDAPLFNTMPSPALPQGGQTDTIILLPTDNEIPSGLYTIAVGIYDFYSLNRLPIVDTSGENNQIVTDNLIQLGTVEIP